MSKYGLFHICPIFKKSVLLYPVKYITPPKFIVFYYEFVSKRCLDWALSRINNNPFLKYKQSIIQVVLLCVT